LRGAQPVDKIKVGFNGIGQAGQSTMRRQATGSGQIARCKHKRRGAARRRLLRVEALEPRHLLAAANLLITEFMASNSAAVADGDGRFSDWIEIHNAGPTAENLSHYSLTDSADDLRRWVFPSRLINAGEYLLVFASSPTDGAGGTLSNYVDAGGNLHTNFSLDADGEYLALAYRDPATSLVSIVYEYAPGFAPQRADISYGTGQVANEVDFVTAGAAARTIVPTNSAYDAVWNSQSYTPDNNWSGGATGVGFGETFNGFLARTYQANIAAGSPIGNTVDNIEEALEVIGNPAAQSSMAAGNFGVVNFINNSTTGGNYDSGNNFFPGLTGADVNHFVTEVHAVVTIPTAGNWTFGVASNEGFLLQVGDFEIERFGTGDTDQFLTINFATAGNYNVHFYNFERTGSTWMELFAAPGTFTSWNGTNFRLVGDVANGGLAVVSDVVGSNGASINQLIGTNVKSQMLGVGSTFYTRISFNVADAAAIDQLTLRMKYDDAFVAYINGMEVARRNVTGTPAWNTVADSPRTGGEVVVYEDINITPLLSTLTTGPNLLAIQGLNFSASDPDVLVMPELVGRDNLSTSPAYFTSPTPRAANASGYAGFVEDTKFSVDRGFYDAPFQVAITSLTPAAQVFYTTNGDEPTQTGGTLYTGPVDINRTTVLRSKAFLAGYLPTNVDTQTYLFVDDIVQQNHANTLALGFPTSWGSSVPNGSFPGGPDYGLDPDIVGNFDANGNPIGGDLFGGLYANQLKDALVSIPTLSIVMDIDDLFSASAGIYTNASQRGVAWERPTSVEWITTDGTPESQVDAGIRIQGAFFRSNSNNLKKSFRLLFKDIYGPGKLNFPLFGEGAVDSFNTLVLRGGGNDGYTWNSAKLTEQYTRDQFMRELQLASGHPSPHSNFAHLYINGVYWGLYNPVERPDGEFAASYLGGNPDSYDVIHRGGGGFEVNQGDRIAWDAMMALAEQAVMSHAAFMQLQGKNLDGTPNPATPPLLDLVSYVDYIIVNAWGGNWDWPRNNYWAARDRNPLTTSGFHFFNWDGENTLGNNRSRSPVDKDVFDPSTQPGIQFGQDGSQSPLDNAGRPHSLLKTNPEYRQLFADRVFKLFFNDGVLTSDSVTARYQAAAATIEQAMIGESARWGDMQAHRSPAPNRALTPADWIAERDWILGTYLPQRSGIVLDQFKGYGLYPNVAAPTFNRRGGHVPVGFDLSVTAPAGAIWYTLDGSDPRATGGAVGSTAILHNGGTIDIPTGMTVKARARSGSEWSARNEATFITAAPADATNLRITEVHYHPASHPSVNDADDLEFLELLNTSDQTVSLAGVEIAEFASPYVYAFDAELMLAPGERIVVARNAAVFQSVYGDGINVAPSGFEFDGKNLSNSGERIELRGPGGATLQTFTYSDTAPWPTAADGGGPSLEIIDPMGDASDPENWRASFYAGGSPGAVNLATVGDYDRNGLVAQDDYLRWRADFGLLVRSGSGADGNGNGVVDTADFVLWRRSMSAAATAAHAVIDSSPAEAGPAINNITPAALSISNAPDINKYIIAGVVSPSHSGRTLNGSLSPQRRGTLSADVADSDSIARTRTLLIDLAFSGAATERISVRLPTSWDSHEGESDADYRESLFGTTAEVLQLVGAQDEGPEVQSR
jgi:CotH kinase protein/Lamin Tail Domain/Chitobiase/beta-hexosaminidase C-terminal domain